MIDEVHLSSHARARFHERVRPGLDYRAAVRELERLIADFSQVSAERPDWLGEWIHEEPAEAWLVLTDDIALPLWTNTGGHKRWAATSCLTRAGLAPGERDHVSRGRRRRRARGRARSNDQGRKTRGKDAKANRSSERRWSEA